MDLPIDLSAVLKRTSASLLATEPRGKTMEQWQAAPPATAVLEDDGLSAAEAAKSVEVLVEGMLGYVLDALRRGFFVAPLKPRSKQPAAAARRTRRDERLKLRSGHGGPRIRTTTI